MAANVVVMTFNVVVTNLKYHVEACLYYIESKLSLALNYTICRLSIICIDQIVSKYNLQLNLFQVLYFADWQKENDTGVIYYTQDSKVRGAMMCNVWDKVPAARELIKSGKKMTSDDLRGAIR
jgi:hypothetical protein